MVTIDNFTLATFFLLIINKDTAPRNVRTMYVMSSNPRIEIKRQQRIEQQIDTLETRRLECVGDHKFHLSINRAPINLGCCSDSFPRVRLSRINFGPNPS